MSNETQSNDDKGTSSMIRALLNQVFQIGSLITILVFYRDGVLRLERIDTSVRQISHDCWTQSQQLAFTEDLRDVNKDAINVPSMSTYLKKGK